MRRLLMMIVAGVALSGCTTINEMMAYDSTVHHVQMPEDRYRVFEHPKRDRIMTTPSMGTTMAIGATSGATLNIARIDPPEVLHERAARQYLDDTGRAHCTITSSRLIGRPQYEFVFDCSAASLPAAALSSQDT